MTKNRIMVTSFAHLNASGVLHIYRLKFSKAISGLGWKGLDWTKSPLGFSGP